MSQQPTNQDPSQVEVLYPKLEEHGSVGVDLQEIKAEFIKHDRNNLYKTIFIIYSLLVFYLLIRVYLSTDFSKLATLIQQGSKDTYFVSNQWFRITLWIGIIFLFLVQLAAFWQKKLHRINDMSMGILSSAYLSSIIYWATSRPLFNFLNSYYTNKAPYKNFSSSLEVLQQTNIALLVLSLIVAVLLFLLAYLLIVLKRFNIHLVKIKK